LGFLIVLPDTHDASHIPNTYKDRVSTEREREREREKKKERKSHLKKLNYIEFIELIKYII